MAQFWDGRSPNVEDQAMGPVLNSVEMAMPDVEHVATVLNGISKYVVIFDYEDTVQKALKGFSPRDYLRAIDNTCIAHLNRTL